MNGGGHLHAVLAHVGDHLRLDALQRRGRIGVGRHRPAGIGFAAAHCDLRRRGSRLEPGDEPEVVIGQQRQHRFVGLILRLEDAFLSAGLDVEPIEEGTIALRRRSDAGHEDVVAVLEHNFGLRPRAPSGAACPDCLGVFQLRWNSLRGVAPGASMTRCAPCAYRDRSRSARSIRLKSRQRSGNGTLSW